MWLKSVIRTAILVAYAALILLVYGSYTIEFDPFAFADANIKTTKPFKQLLTEMRPVLAELSTRKFFRYFRVDVSRECPFWEEDPHCPSGNLCTLTCPCPDDSMPKSWLEEDHKTRERNAFSAFSAFAKMDIHKPHRIVPDNWDFDFVGNQTMYVDLTKDKEAYTGYQGQKVWNSLYTVQCAEIAHQCGRNNPISKLLSGMHTSVSSHLTEYFVEFLRTRELHYPNPKMYFEKVGKHPDRMQNLLMAFQVMLRAMVRISDQLSDYEMNTEDFSEDILSRKLLQQLISIVSVEKDTPFDSSELFQTTRGQLGEQFDRLPIYMHFFRNVTEMMDCVECQKCKVYGKLQVLGLGVAMKSLIRDHPATLTRNEMVAFVNTLNKWSESIEIIERMKRRLRTRKWVKVGIITTVVSVLLFLLARVSGSQRKRSQPDLEKPACCRRN
jgi:ERO1-like protein alpha